MSDLANPWLLTPLLLAALLALARLARLRPVLRPLLVPFVLLALCGVALSIAGREALERRGWLGLLLLAPLVVLLVRGSVIVFDALFRRSQREAPPSLLDSVVSVALYGVATGLVARYHFGVDLTPFLATSAVVGAVVGLALQDTLGNLFAGIALHTEAPFRVGDWIRASGDTEGCVEQISWRAVRLRTWYGDTLIIPNNEVSRHRVQNFSRPRVPHSRVLTVGVSYETPPNRVLGVLRDVLGQVTGLPEEPQPHLRVIGYHDFFIQYEVRYYVDSYEDYRRVESEIYRLIWYHFRRSNVEIPYPIRTIHLRRAETRGRDAHATRLERALRTIDLFRPLSDEELSLAAGGFRHAHYAAGERILEEGEAGDSFFVIDRGEVEVSKQLGGKRRPVANLLEGQFFGEMALLTGERRVATVVAHTDVDVFRIDKAGFEKILVANPAVAEDISAILAERRDALSHAEGDITKRFASDEAGGDLRQRILARIRSYFGL